MTVVVATSALSLWWSRCMHRAAIVCTCAVSFHWVAGCRLVLLWLILAAVTSSSSCHSASACRETHRRAALSVLNVVGLFFFAPWGILREITLIRTEKVAFMGNNRKPICSQYLPTSLLLTSNWRYNMALVTCPKVGTNNRKKLNVRALLFKSAQLARHAPRPGSPCSSVGIKTPQDTANLKTGELMQLHVMEMLTRGCSPRGFLTVATAP